MFVDEVNGMVGRHGEDGGDREGHSGEFQVNAPPQLEPQPAVQP